MKRTARLLCLCLAAYGSAASAAVVPWLYTAEAAVRSQSAGDRHRAASTGLAEVLTRLTGLAPLPDHADVASALAAPERFYARYEYVQRQAEADAPAQVLVFHFDPGPVLRLLRQADLPVWAADRPRTLAWVVLQQQGERRLIGGAGPLADAIAGSLRQRARERGLELSLPLMDLTDAALSPTAVWGLFWEDIDAASARYAPDLLLVGRLRQAVDGWHTEWQLRSRGAASPVRLYDLPLPAGSTRRNHQGEPVADAFRHDRPTAALAASAAVDGVATTLAERFAVRGALTTIDAVVSAAQTVPRYAALLAYLQSREYIERVDVHTVRVDAIGLRLHSRSSPAQLRELLGMGNAFAPGAADAAAPGALALVWQGTQ